MKLHPEGLKFAVLATDIAIFTIKEGVLLARMIKVNRPPHFVNQKGLPGGLILPEETAEEAARRIIKTKALIDPKKTYLEQLYTFSKIERDPRGRVVAVAYTALVPWEDLSQSEQLGNEETWWSPVLDCKNLAYDHDEMLLTALGRVRSRITYTTLIGKLMPKEFTLTDLEKVYERILNDDLDKRNFRKKVLKLKVITPLNKKRQGGKSRPAELYSFPSEKVLEISII